MNKILFMANSSALCTGSFSTARFYLTVQHAEINRKTHDLENDALMFFMICVFFLQDTSFATFYLH